MKMIASNIVADSADRAARAIPPLWPLASSVAVNPFLGQAGETLAQTGARLGRVAAAPVTMPRNWYRAQIRTGMITDADLLAAWNNAPRLQRPIDLAALRMAITQDAPVPSALPTIADLAASVSGVDWPGLIADRFGSWAAGYFDAGQALWAAPRERSAYAAWRAVATHDLTPEIAGLAGFARHIAETPDQALATMTRALSRLNAEAPTLETYFHQLLMTLGGWAQYARFLQWQADLDGRTESTVVDLLAIRLIWEEALFARYAPEISTRWADTLAHHAKPVEPSVDLVLDCILQDAAEHAGQRRLAALLAAETQDQATNRGAPARPALQAAFCIDVRSERFRRALEQVNLRIRTLGFAGFFGLATAHRRFGSDIDELRGPALFHPSLRCCAGDGPMTPPDQAARITARARRAWGRFKLAAISSFAFVEATGPLYAAKLIGDALGLGGAPNPSDPAPHLVPALALNARVDTAATVLRAMSLTRDFATLVLLVGHGAQVVNNPYASALQCGACGGYAGEVNARLLAALLNDPAVRAELAETGITIPSDTLFVAALHDTTTDDVTLYGEDQAAPDHQAGLQQARQWLATAGWIARCERATGLPRAADGADILRRSRDWAEIRPEWALAGCNSFIAAPRDRTAGKMLDGRTFLHEYDWRIDQGFGVLELILTAPVIVASWISLSYYGAVVAPAVFGAGNKLIHNVTGGIGVVEGNGGLLRGGHPWQSVHDGERLIHEPLRLIVCLEAPRDAITAILRRHAAVRMLFDHGWLSLFALDERGHMAWQYAGDLEWRAFDPAPHRVAAEHRSPSNPSDDLVDSGAE
jgi:uncharacterized protein YbcC (UPF0753/DUF2309 family)